MNKRQQAWRNMMVAAINAGLEQKAFGLGEADNWWPDYDPEKREPHMYAFDVGRIPVFVYVSDGGHGELWLQVAFWPTTTAYEWAGCDTAGFEAGEAFASGWIERAKGKWLQTPTLPDLKYRSHRLDTVAALRLKAKGYPDSGKFML